MRLSRLALPALAAFCLAAMPAFAGKFDDHDGKVTVVTHMDIIPDFVAQAQPLIEQFVLDSRKDPGVEQFTMITWDPTTNHFQLIEVFSSKRAFDAHVSAPHTVAFRNAVQGFIGAPYDERLYRDPER